jgi:hypothetical protein
MNINYKKSLKLLTLLVTSLLIATVSATIYDYMYLNGSVGVQGMALKWVDGADATDAGTQINGVTATLTQLKGPPNGTRIYADPVRLWNNGTSAASIDILIDAVTGDTTEMDSIVVRIYNLNTTSWVQNMTIWSGGAKGSDATGLSVTSYHSWRFQWEIKWKSTATTANSVTVNLKIKVPV